MPIIRHHHPGPPTLSLCGQPACWLIQWAACGQQRQAAHTSTIGSLGSSPRGRLTQEQVLHEIDRQYQLATGGRCLPPMSEGRKGWKCAWARSRGDPSGWMDGLKDMIAEVGLEAAVRLVAANPEVLWRASGSLARDISVYMEETGWSRGEVVRWMTQPKCSMLLTRSAATVIRNLKSSAASLGLA